MTNQNRTTPQQLKQVVDDYLEKMDIASAALLDSESADAGLETFYMSAWSVIRECAYSFTLLFKDSGIEALKTYDEFLRGQLNYFAKFAREVDSGRQTFDKSLQFRARMYIWSCWYYYNALELKLNSKLGFKFVRRLAIGCEGVDSEFIPVKQFVFKDGVFGKECFAYQEFKK